MALYSMHMATISSVLRSHGQPTQDLTLKFLEHFSLIRNAVEHEGLWDDTDGFFYDRIAMADGSRIPIKVRSMVGVLPVLASVVVDEVLIQRAEALGKGFATLLGRNTFDMAAMAEHAGCCAASPDNANCWWASSTSIGCSASSIVCSPSTSSSPPTGSRVSQAHRDARYNLEIGDLHATIDYEPAESTDEHVRREFELARPHLVPAELSPAARSACTAASSATR